MPVSVHHAIDTVGADVIGEHLEGVGMRIEGIFLREVDGNGTVCGLGVTRAVIV